MEAVNVRYIVDDVAEAIVFYTDQLGFRLETNPGPGFAMLSRGNLRLLLNAPGAGGAGRAGTPGARPQPGGWNRFQLPVSDLEKTVTALEAAGAEFRSDMVTGKGGRQILVADPAGNAVELFESFD